MGRFFQPFKTLAVRALSDQVTNQHLPVASCFLSDKALLYARVLTHLKYFVIKLCGIVVLVAGIIVRVDREDRLLYLEVCDKFDYHSVSYIHCCWFVYNHRLSNWVFWNIKGKQIFSSFGAYYFILIVLLH
jgi:hypothetical protein